MEPSLGVSCLALLVATYHLLNPPRGVLTLSCFKDVKKLRLREWVNLPRPHSLKLSVRGLGPGSVGWEPQDVVHQGHARHLPVPRVTSFNSCHAFPLPAGPRDS